MSESFATLNFILCWKADMRHTFRRGGGIDVPVFKTIDVFNDRDVKNDYLSHRSGIITQMRVDCNPQF